MSELFMTTMVQSRSGRLRWSGSIPLSMSLPELYRWAQASLLGREQRLLCFDPECQLPCMTAGPGSGMQTKDEVCKSDIPVAESSQTTT
jgi:hypothetical protein